MRCVILICATALALPAGEAAPAPATLTTSQGSGPTAGERTTTASLAADDAWSRARAKAQNEQRLRQAQAARDSVVADTTGAETTSLDPGGLASLIDGDEIALLLELQRRRRNADGTANKASDDLLTRELAAILLTPPPRQSATPQPHDEVDVTTHPDQAPHAGPVPLTPVNAPDRPEHLPNR